MLTLDAAMQGAAEAALHDAVREHDAKGGMVITLDPKNGDVLALAEAPGFDPNRFRELDLVRVKGKSKPVAIFEPIGDADSLDDDQRVALAEYEKALAAYRGCDWDNARQLFEKLKERNGELLYSVYLDRIDRFSHEPPAADWDGVFDHLSK